MTQDLNSSVFLPLLNVGNVVSAGLVIYRSHLKAYSGISLIANLWLVVPSLVVVFLTNSAEIVGPIVLLVLLLLFLIGFVYCMANYWLNAALISRLAYNELTNQMEAISTARSQLQSRFWSFLVVALRVGLLLTLIYLGSAIVAAGIGFALGALIGTVAGQVAGYTIGFISAVVIIVIPIIWFVSRWIIAEVPLAVETEMTAAKSIDRSWELTQSLVSRVIAIAIVTFVVTFPIMVLTNVPQLFLVQLEQQTPRPPIYWIIFSIATLANLIGGILVLPFWQAIKAVLYYDLRNRREGLDLQFSRRLDT